MSKTLRCYDIPERVRTILDQGVDPETGELNAHALSELAALNESVEDATANLACYIRELELEADSVKTVALSSAERAGKLTKQAERYRDYVKAALEAAGLERVKDSRITLALQNNPERVQVDNESGLPLEFMRVTTQSVPDKVAIKIALNAGREINGCSLIATRRLSIK